MAKTKTSFKKGEAKGKPKGALNRTTKEAKEFLEFVMFGQLDNMNDALCRLYKQDPSRYLDACSKLFAYVIPKKTDLTSDNKPIFTELPVIQIKSVND
jgi:hypothetical protein